MAYQEITKERQTVWYEEGYYKLHEVFTTKDQSRRHTVWQKHQRAMVEPEDCKCGRKREERHQEIIHTEAYDNFLSKVEAKTIVKLPPVAVGDYYEYFDADKMLQGSKRDYYIKDGLIQHHSCNGVKARTRLVKIVGETAEKYDTTIHSLLTGTDGKWALQNKKFGKNKLNRILHAFYTKLEPKDVAKRLLKMGLVEDQRPQKVEKVASTICKKTVKNGRTFIENYAWDKRAYNNSKYEKTAMLGINVEYDMNSIRAYDQFGKKDMTWNVGDAAINHILSYDDRTPSKVPRFRLIEAIKGGVVYFKKMDDNNNFWLRATMAEFIEMNMGQEYIWDIADLYKKEVSQ